MAESNSIPLKEYLEKLINENDKRYTDRFAAQEKAITKAETAQASYNQNHNDLIKHGETQALLLMPRLETQAMFKAFEEKLKSLDETLTKRSDENRVDITQLQLNSSAGGGKEEASEATQLKKQWSIGLMMVGLLSVAGLLVSILSLLKK